MATAGEKDGSTRLHTDLSLAANKNLSCKKKKGSIDQAIGAVWDIFSPQDRDRIADYLRKHRGHKGKEHPIHAQRYYLAGGEISFLRESYGVCAHSFTQLPGETVFIPAGAPHQVSFCQYRIHLLVKLILLDRSVTSPHASNLQWILFFQKP